MRSKNGPQSRNIQEIEEKKLRHAGKGIKSYISLLMRLLPG